MGDYTGSENGIVKAGSKHSGNGKYGMGGLVDDMWQVWRRRKMDEILAGSLLDVVVAQGKGMTTSSSLSEEDVKRSQKRKSQKVFQGGDGPKPAGRYIPVMEKPRMESVEVINAKYARRKGFEQSEVIRERGFKRVEIEKGG